jgi:hypothetical protein
MKHFLLLVVVVLFFASPTMGLCNVPRPRLVCAEYFASQVVVEATLIKVRSIHDKDDPEGVAAFGYSLHESRVIRGHIEPVFIVHEGNDSGRTTFDWKIGRVYLLFLSYSDSDKAWELDGCGNSGPVSGAKAALQQIAAIQAGHGGGVFHGVISEQALSAPISDIHVEARGANGRYAATTNPKGEFEIKVPAGRYAVRAIKAGSLFATADFSYEDPDKVRVESGGCALVQLVSVGSPAAHKTLQDRLADETDSDVKKLIVDSSIVIGLAPAQSTAPASVLPRFHMKQEQLRCNILNVVNPVCPKEARLAHTDGVVNLSMVIVGDGTVADLQAVSGDPILLDSTVRAIRVRTG